MSSEHVVAIACGGAHTCCITGAGEVWQWGDPISGQLGLVSSGPVRFPSLVFPSCCSVRPLRVVRQVEELNGQQVVTVDCGSFHTSCVTATGEMYTWGHGGEGRLGHGDEANQLKPRVVRGLASMPVVQVSSFRLLATTC